MIFVSQFFNGYQEKNGGSVLWVLFVDWQITQTLSFHCVFSLDYIVNTFVVLDSKCGSTNGLSESKATVDLICISNPNTGKSIQCVSFKVFLFCHRSQERYNLLFLSFELTGSPFFTLDLELFGVHCWFLSMAVWLQFKNIGTIPYMLLGGKKNALFYSLHV